MAKWEVPDDMFRKDSPSRSGKRLGMRMILIMIIISNMVKST